MLLLEVDQPFKRIFWWSNKQEDTLEALLGKNLSFMWEQFLSNVVIL